MRSTWCAQLCQRTSLNSANIHLQIHEEVQFQMRRINWHPSVVIWGGNNEVETAMGSWFEAARDNPSLYVADYAELFLNTVQQAVAHVDRAFPFVDSSPSNGLLSIDPYVKRSVPCSMASSVWTLMWKGPYPVCPLSQAPCTPPLSLAASGRIKGVLD